ncbi:MAG: DUF4893 domain-containing protein [Rhizomicrobium sp.]
MRARMLRLSLTAAALAVFASTAEAGWQDEASPYDVNRLAKLGEARAKALDEAQAGADLPTIHAVLDPAPQPVSADALMGAWRCRTIKLGGLTPDVVYGWFRCRIMRERGNLFFEKLSGSQRIRGALYPYESGGYVLLGALSVSGEPMHRYSGNHASAGAIATPDDAIGLLVGTGAGHARIEFPYPVQESTFDVIELKR